MPYQNVTMRPMESRTFDRRAWPEGGALDHWNAPDGWPLRRFRIGDGRRGRLLFVGGRGDTIEKYLETMADWAGRGWRVTSFDWRGQGGSGRLHGNSRLGHVDDFATWVADLRAFVNAWRAEGEGPYVLVAHSMGGHIALRAMAEGAVHVDAAVLVAPMLGLNARPIPDWLAPCVAAFMCRIGFALRPVWRDGSRSPERGSHLTHSAERYADELWWRSETPEIALGPPSWRWIAEAYRSNRALGRSPALAEMRTPLLMLAARADRLVSFSAIRDVAARLPHARLHAYGEEAAHEILREADPVRRDALARIDAFLDESAPAR